MDILSIRRKVCALSSYDSIRLIAFFAITASNVAFLGSSIFSRYSFWLCCVGRGKETMELVSRGVSPLAWPLCVVSQVNPYY